MPPAPSSHHPSCVGSLPPDPEAFGAPFDRPTGPGRFLQPDVLIARRSDVQEPRLSAVAVVALD